MDEEKTASKGGRIGCGPVMIFVMMLVLIGAALGTNEALRYYYKHCPAGEENIDCLLRRGQDPEPEGAVAASGVYSFKGYSVTVTAKIPLKGGAVTGTVSGTCDGSLKGSYDGKNKGGFSGKMFGVCSPFFVNIPASATFYGIVNKDAKTAPISFKGGGGGFSHSDSMSLSY